RRSNPPRATQPQRAAPGRDLVAGRLAAGRRGTDRAVRRQRHALARHSDAGMARGRRQRDRLPACLAHALTFTPPETVSMNRLAVLLVAATLGAAACSKTREPDDAQLRTFLRPAGVPADQEVARLDSFTVLCLRALSG